MKDKQPIDSLFRDGLASRKMTPPPSAWDSIQGNLNQNKRSFRGIYLFSAIAASICLLTAATWTFVGADKTEEQIPYSGKINSVDKRTTTQLEIEEPTQLSISLPETLSILASANAADSNPILDQSEAQQTELVIIDIKLIGIMPVQKNKILSSAEPSHLIKPQFDLPGYIMEAESQFVQPRGRRFNFVKGMVTMAKGVSGGKKAISEIRKSKIEFVNEELKYGSEKESEDEATIDQDSPSNEK